MNYKLVREKISNTLNEIDQSILEKPGHTLATFGLASLLTLLPIANTKCAAAVNVSEDEHEKNTEQIEIQPDILTDATIADKTNIAYTPTLEIPAKVSDSMKSPHSDTTLSLTELNELVAKFNGSFTVAGMPTEIYDATMNKEWQQMISLEEPADLTFQINQKYNYREYEGFILNLARYDYVTVYNMGSTINDRAIYNIEIFNPSDEVDPSEVITIMINGGTHANETMGTHVTLKMAEEFIKRIQSDEKLQEYAKRVRITILPCLNPDGRELVYLGGNDNRKSNAEGIDINRNFPSINAGVLRNGNSNPNAKEAASPGRANYPGSFLGEAWETRIAMKWINHYIINGNAAMLLDLHQQGNGIYATKPFDTANNKKRQNEFYNYLKNTLKTNGSITYGVLSDSPVYGYNGVGGTLTDYIFCVAMGFPYSPRYGRQVITTSDKEISLHEMNSLNDYANVIQPVNPNFTYATIEMTSSGAKGFSNSALEAQLKHYNSQNFTNLLKCLMERTLGIEKTALINNAVKEQTATQYFQANNPNLELIPNYLRAYRAQNRR